MSGILNIVLSTAGGPSVLKTLGGITTAIGGMALAAAAVSKTLTGVRSALDLGGELNDLHARTGQTVRDLVITRRAFDNAGIGAAATAPMIGLLQKAIAGLNEEGGRTEDIFKKLGLSPEALKKMSAVDQIQALATAFSKIVNPSERAAIAMQLFGRSGAQMLQLLADPNALRNAEREAGRLAARLQENAAGFDDIGDRLSIMKLRMQEFWVIAAEKALPIMGKMATLAEGINPSVAGAGSGAVLATLIALAGGWVFNKMDTLILEWATRPGVAVMGQRFAANFLAPMSGALAVVLPIGLAAAVGAAIALGIASGVEEWRGQQLAAAGGGFDALARVQGAAGGIRTGNDRASAATEAQAMAERTQQALAVEEARWWRNERAIASYRQQLSALRALLAMLNGDWALTQMALNQAADAVAAIAARQKEAAEWLKGDAAEKMRDQVTAAVDALRTDEERLANARANVSIHERQLALAKAMTGQEQYSSETQKLRLQAAAGLYTWLVKIADIERAIATKNVEAAQEQLNRADRLRALQRATLDGDFSRTEASKWPERRALLLADIKSANQTLDNLSALLANTKDESARATYRGAISGQLDKLAGLEGQRGQLGADPSSFTQQMASAITEVQNQIGTVMQQLSGAFSSVGESIRTSLGGAFADMILQATSFKDAAIGFGQAIGTSFVNTGAQMVADWIYSHLIMDNIRRLFGIKSIGETAAVEATKTGIQAEASAVRTGIVIAEETAKASAVAVGAATTTGVVVAEAGTQAAVTGPAAVLRSIMELGPIAGPIVLGVSLVAMLALINSLMSGFETGGFTGGREGALAGVVHGEEFVFSAPAVRALGLDTLESMHAGALSGSSLSDIAAPGGALSATGATDMASLVDAIAKKIRITNIVEPDRRAAQRIERRSRAADDVVEIVRGRRSEIFRNGPR